MEKFATVQAAAQLQPVSDAHTLLLGKNNGAKTQTVNVYVTRACSLACATMSAQRQRMGVVSRLIWNSGTACVCAAAIVTSLTAFFVKLLGPSIPVFEIVAFRSVIALAVCIASGRASGIHPLLGSRANLPLLLSRGLFGSAAMTTYYFAIKMLPLADAVTLYFLNPAIISVVAWAALKEPLGGRGVVGVLVCICGLLCLTRPPFLFNHLSFDFDFIDDDEEADDDRLNGDGDLSISTADAVASGGAVVPAWSQQQVLGTALALLAAVLAAAAFLSIRLLGKREPSLVVSVYFHMCAALTSIVPLAVGFPAPAVWPTGSEWALLLGVATCSFWGQILIGRGFQLLHAARASAINLTQVVYSYLLGLMFLHDKLNMFGVGGSALIAAGAVLVNLKASAPKPPAAAAATEKGDGSAAVPLDGCKGDPGALLDVLGQQLPSRGRVQIDVEAGRGCGMVEMSMPGNGYTESCRGGAEADPERRPLLRPSSAAEQPDSRRLLAGDGGANA